MKELGRILTNGRILDLDSIPIKELEKETREVYLRQEQLKKEIQEMLEKLLSINI